MNKKNLIVGLTLTVCIIFLLQYLFNIDLISCGEDPRLTCYTFVQQLTAFGLGLVPVFVLSCATYFANKTFFKAWKKLVVFYILFLAFFVSISSADNGGYIGSSDMEIVLPAIVIIFVVASIVIIIQKCTSPDPYDA